MYYQNKVTVITGGSSGIGLALAKELVMQGAKVWLVARTLERLEQARDELNSLSLPNSYPCKSYSADVSDAKQVAQLVEKITQEDGLPELLINSAGVAKPGYFQDLDLDAFHWMMDINYFGTVNITKAIVPGMIERGSGQIVNISSIAGFLGVFGYTAYTASKFAVRGFSDVLRSELKPHGIYVSVVFPPDTDTPQLAYDNQNKPRETKELTDIGTVLSAERVAQEILRGVARRRYIILPGTEGKLFFWLNGWLGTGVYNIMDWLVGRAIRNGHRKPE